MLRANCPNCGGPIAFRSSELPVKVCEYCRSSILRTGGNLQDIGKAAEVPDDVSPLQLGVTGRDMDRTFQLIGRVRWRYADGAWNEWLALYDDGTTGWLGESMGRYMLLRQVELPPADMQSNVITDLQRGVGVQPGTEAVVNGVKFWATDVKTVSCVASEGELPFAAPLGLTYESIDLMAADENCASIQKDADGVIEIYAGRYVTLAEIAASGLREFEGWPMPAYRA